MLETLPGFTLSGNLYRPKGTVGKVPALLCAHGHWEDGCVNPEVHQRCICWAKLGAVVFMYDIVGYNDSKPFTHVFLNDRLRRWGFSLASLQTWNSIRALDWLTSLPDVDSARIGCTGESGGGTQTFLLTALDPRIKVAAPVVMVSDSFQGGCVCENAAGLRHGTDNAEFAALAAPRPMILVGASGDWTARTMTNAFPAIRGVYSRAARLGASRPPSSTSLTTTTRPAAKRSMPSWGGGRWGSRTLRAPAKARSSPRSPKPPSRSIRLTRPRPSRKTPAELEADLVKRLGSQIEAMAPRQAESERWEASRRFLNVSLRNRVGLENPPPESIDAREVRRLARECFSIVHWQLGRRTRGDAIPIVRLTPTHASGRVTVIAVHEAKRGWPRLSGSPRS